jgi:Protein of unknown function (DUF3303)
MKYVVCWTLRPGGAGVDNEEAIKRSLAVFAKWSPPASQTFLQFLGRLDGQGGFAVIETDDPLSLQDGPSKFGPYFDFQIFPVAEITEAARAGQEGIEFRASIS